jgi:hypothetical protein
VVIEAVQVGPAEFIVVAEQLRAGDEFAEWDQAWRVVDEPVEVRPRVLLVNVRVTAGADTGHEFTAQVRVSRPVA